MEDRKPVILCVDDDPDYLYALRAILEANGYTMVEAATAQEALRVFKEAKPDLVIVDLMMEEIDSGSSLVKELRFQGCEAPIYMLSAVGDALHQSIDTSELGVAGVFQKPIKPEDLLATLEAQLKK